MKWPSPQVLGRYALEHKEPLAPGTLPDHCELVGGEFWTGEIARHDRLRLAYAVWACCRGGCWRNPDARLSAFALRSG